MGSRDSVCHVEMTGVGHVGVPQVVLVEQETGVKAMQVQVCDDVAISSLHALD
jgi:hypothetical protein